MEPTDDDSNVKRLPVRFKNPLPDDRSLVFLHEVPRSKECMHYGAQYIVDESLAEVECSKCAQKLNPMWVLKMLCVEDRRFHEGQKRYQEEMQRLSERARTKCQNCGKMTRISHR